MWAQRSPAFYNHFGERGYVELYLAVGPQDPIVPVEVTEDESGTYWGWIEAEGGPPVMIQPHRILFDIQFPYGPRVEEEGGSGRIVQLSVQEIEH
jgi:hypothetical protein